MRRISSISARWVLPLIMLASVYTTPAPVQAARIDATRGRKYTLTKRHGPWMIMVATFTEVPEELRTDGLTPQQAADELVFELRSKGIPAYSFVQKDVFDNINTTDRTGRDRDRRYAAVKGGIGVLAGNYPDSDDKVAHTTLEYIKKFHPKFLRSVESRASAGRGSIIQKLRNGGLYRSSPGRPGPLSGAFLTTNPMLSAEDVARRSPDPLLLRLNANQEFSLVDNPGKYTLVVATSYVKSITHTGADARDLEAKFKVTSDLDEAAENAWLLARSLREGHFRLQASGNLPVKAQRFEAYVYHDRKKSVVTVGSFDDPRDPRIRQLQELFGAKVRKNPQTGQDVLIAELLTLNDPRNPGNSVRSWIFDPKPALIQTPHHQ